MAFEAQHHDAGALKLPRIRAAVRHMATDAASAICRWMGENERETLFGMTVDAGAAVRSEDGSCDVVVPVD